jgi:Leucine-rich repeat (LRR) protein
MTNLQSLNLGYSELSSIPEWLAQLTNLQSLDLTRNKLTSIPEWLAQLTNLQSLDLSGNELTDLSLLQELTQNNLRVHCFGANLPRRYWMKVSDWQPEWLLDETNAEIRRVLIQQVSYEKIYDRLGAEEIDTWREYTLLKIDNIQVVYKLGKELREREPMLLLKMTCPSTGHIHILRVSPEMESAEAAITWVNHDIHPDNIAIQT